MRTQTPGRPTAAPRIAVDYPQEGELITSPTYTFRIDAAAPRVEIAIDGGDWSPCRRSDDYWWFDWSDYESGRHQAIVRGAAHAGAEPASRTCRFLVEISGRRGS
ncbi:MAG TPA: hypothetical protein VH309_13845 [Elusimicrobiota bacterium]|jgi:hypothetical protein|nr:hypothetical protein [Elusimicrobiota bacterium]